MNQVMKVEKLFELCCNKWPELKNERTLFDEAVELCNKNSVFTGIANGYAYQTTSLLKKQKTDNEIIEIVGF